MGSGMGSGFQEAHVLSTKVAYAVDLKLDEKQRFNEQPSVDLSHSSLPPILPQILTRPCVNPYQTLPSIGLSITTTVPSRPRTEPQRNSLSPVHRHSPYGRPPSSQKASPPQRVSFPHANLDRSTEQNFQSPMRMRQEANPPPLFTPLTRYQPPSSDEPRESSSSAAMNLSSILNDVPTVPITQLYSLRVRQQPVDGRMCGNGLGDRRHIDPPPVVQLFLNDPSMNIYDLDKYFVALHCFLWNEETDNEERLTDEHPGTIPRRRLEGNVSANPAIGPDEKNEIGCFFLFSDLSCRTKGRWRLRFALTVTSRDPVQGMTFPFVAECLSDVFQVSEPTGQNRFRGMTESTPLTKALKQMGCNVKLRRGTTTNGPRTGTLIRGSSEGENENEGEERPARPRPTGATRGRRRRRGGRS